MSNKNASQQQQILQQRIQVLVAIYTGKPYNLTTQQATSIATAQASRELGLNYTGASAAAVASVAGGATDVVNGAAGLQQIVPGSTVTQPALTAPTAVNSRAVPAVAVINKSTFPTKRTVNRAPK